MVVGNKMYMALRELRLVELSWLVAVQRVVEPGFVLQVAMVLSAGLLFPIR